MLFQALPIPDRNCTQTAYEAKYFPFSELPVQAEELIVWRKFLKMHKSWLLNRLNDDMTTFMHYSSANRAQEFKLVWAYNNIPTQIEWERKSLGYIVSVDLRILKTEGAIAQLSFY